MSPSDSSVSPAPSYSKIFLQFLQFGLLAWGGPVAQIGMLKEQLVDQEKLITPEKFKRVLAIYQVLPGPEAQELCVYFGYLKGKRLGGLLAGLGFMLPGFVLMLLFSWLYVHYGTNSLLVAAAYGIHPAVTALIIRAIHRIGRHVITAHYLWIVLFLSIAGTLLHVHFAITLAVCGVVTILFSRKQWAAGSIISVALVGVALWFALSPLPTNSVTESVQHNTPAAYFITGLQSGLLTFGGAYTILPFLEHDAVARYGWLSENQFIDGIALASILPAPLVIISTFVGYVGHGLVGAFLITVGVFLPAFGFTLFGHELLERITHMTRLHHFLDGVAAGVVGLIVVTAVTISLYVIQTPSQLLIMAAALVVTYASQSKFTIPLLVLSAGALGVLIQQF